eukprot:TRINITY_DN187_c1_g1_i1.p1 TRINITY_DN187_c1_g1~~TRINITY_DN187_c1_g1_i1.p1  ORF type:complete len:774 (+),score=164.49 TRINITY_DN187_c1_g1_i1:11909-14230(+)
MPPPPPHVCQRYASVPTCASFANASCHQSLFAVLRYSSPPLPPSPSTCVRRYAPLSSVTFLTSLSSSLTCAAAVPHAPTHPTMTNPIKQLEDAVDSATTAYKTQSDVVAKLRCDPSQAELLSAAEQQLRECKRRVDDARKKLSAQRVQPSDHQAIAARAAAVDVLLRRRFFIAPSFEIYGGVAGLYDYGPPGCAVKNNLLAVWRQHFIVEEAMLELEATCLTPAPVLKASGHVDKFNDLMVTDVQTGAPYRADHLLRDHLEHMLQTEPAHALRDEMRHLLATLDELNQSQMDQYLTKYEVKAPDTHNDITPCAPFNLMFETSIGPSGKQVGYLRPETAQGIFVNFKRLLESVGGKLPFACAQIGLSFRNEIKPRGGLLRVREFQQAEIEHFVNPNDKSHPKFDSVRHVSINMFGREQQLSREAVPLRITVGEAVDKALINNETLGYFIARTSLFVEKVGMNMELVRFRQHLEHEMAHYASDCWDLEIKSLSANKWVECAGLADRSAFDLGNHSKKSGIELTARENYAEPRRVEQLVCEPKKSVLGRTFKKNAQVIMKALAEKSEGELEQLKAQLQSEGKVQVNGFEITSDHVSFRSEIKSVSGRSFYPSVIEPSFGVGRILCCLWEHVYYVREGEEDAEAEMVRAVLALPACVAPVKCTVLPLSKNAAFEGVVEEVRAALSAKGLMSRVDDSGISIGRRYSRADEMGTPFGITVDFQSVEDGTVTLRERDSTRQVRGSVGEVVTAVGEMVAARRSWAHVQQSMTPFDAAAAGS